MTAHCHECNLWLSPDDDCLHIKGGSMKPEDEYSWLHRYDKPYSPNVMRAIWGVFIASGVASAIIIAMAVNWLVGVIL